MKKLMSLILVFAMVAMLPVPAAYSLTLSAVSIEPAPEEPAPDPGDDGEVPGEPGIPLPYPYPYPPRLPRGVQFGLEAEKVGSHANQVAITVTAENSNAHWVRLGVISCSISADFTDVGVGFSGGSYSISPHGRIVVGKTVLPLLMIETDDSVLTPDSITNDLVSSVAFPGMGIAKAELKVDRAFRYIIYPTPLPLEEIELLSAEGVVLQADSTDAELRPFECLDCVEPIPLPWPIPYPYPIMVRVEDSFVVSPHYDHVDKVLAGIASVNSNVLSTQEKVTSMNSAVQGMLRKIMYRLGILKPELTDSTSISSVSTPRYRRTYRRVR